MPFKNSTLAIIAVVAIILIIAAVYALSNSSSGSLQGILSAKNLDANALMQAITQRVNSTPQLNISYSGQAVLQSHGGLLGNTQFSMPFQLIYEKNGQNYRVNASITGVPILGNLNLAFIYLNSTKYTCFGGLSSLRVNSSSPSGPTCYKGSSQTPLSSYNLSGTHENLTLISLSQSSVNGMACTLGSWNVNVTAQNSTSSQQITGSVLGGKTTGRISACFSNQYYIPLKANFTSGTANLTVSFSLNATNVNTNPSTSYIDTLPGPVQTQNYTQIAQTTVPYHITTTTNQGSSYLGSCNGILLSESMGQQPTSATCGWTGGILQVWLAGGDAGAVHFSIAGQSSGVTYFDNVSNSRCITYYGPINLPAGTYVISIHSGQGGGSCGASEAALNTTT